MENMNAQKLQFPQSPQSSGGLIFIATLCIFACLYFVYDRMQANFEAQKKFMEGAIETKLKTLDDDIAKRIANIKVINEQKTVTYNNVKTIYQNSQHEIDDIHQAAEKGTLQDLVNMWNSTRAVNTNVPKNSDNPPALFVE